MPNPISVDNPCHKDTLGRVAFARHLLDLVERIDTESSGAVIGLEGAWGTGKTSVLGALGPLIDERPEERRPLLVSFNPWMVSGTSGLVEALLLQLSAEIAPAGIRPKSWWRRCFTRSPSQSPGDRTTLAGTLIEYAGLLSVVKHFSPVANVLLPGSGLILEGIGSASEQTSAAMEPARKALDKLGQQPASLSLTLAKRKVSTALERLGRRVIVLVDDLDRLPPVELAAMVQAVKAVADFPNVVYVLSYDPDVAAQGLRSALEVSDGRVFLEKIVQIPLPLPEVPPRKLNVFSGERLKPAMGALNLRTEESSDLDVAWNVVFPLMQTPRDVERLRTRLLVALPVLEKQINLADVAVLEALALKSPKVVEWIRHNTAAVMTVGLGQYDDILLMRGVVGDPWTEAELRSEGGRERNEERPFEWESLLPPESRARLPVINAMGYLFDKCRRRGRTHPTRSSFQRVQDYRHWSRWRSYHDHHERWPTSDIIGFVAHPSNISAAGLHLDIDAFIELCEQICDVGINSLGTCDSLSLVKVFHEAEVSLGTDVVVQRNLGFGPWEALVLCMRLDNPAGRLAALEWLIDHASVWLSGPTVMRAWRDVVRPQGGEDVPLNRILLPDQAALNPVLDRWFAVADTHLQHSPWAAPSADYCPYRLLAWMRLMGRNTATLRQIAARFIGKVPDRLRVLVSGLADAKHRAFPLEVDWDILPDPDDLERWINADTSFGSTHKMFIDALRREQGRRNSDDSLHSLQQAQRVEDLN